MISEIDIKNVGKILQDSKRPMKERFRSLFTLKNIGGETAIHEISLAFSDDSALLKHELAYCLGQMKDKRAIPILIEVLKEESQEPMVRHEAGEALGAIGCSSVSEVLEIYSKDKVIEVAETCQLALARIKWLGDKDISENEFNSTVFPTVDPVPPCSEKDIKLLESRLLNENLPLFDRYRAIFSLRNINTKDSAKAISKGFKCSSSLFRHEIGYVLGQMSCDNVVDELSEVVRNKHENEMVRHEAAEALGSIATDSATKTLKKFLTDNSRVVRESCEVALDMCQYESSDQFQYADALSVKN